MSSLTLLERVRSGIRGVGSVPSRSSWSLSFNRKLQLTLAVMVIFAVVIAGVSYWKSVQSARLLERSRLGHQVLQTYLEISSATYELYKVLNARIESERAGRPIVSLSTEDELVLQIETKVVALRQLISDEIALVGNVEAESGELERLGKVDRRITRFVNEYRELTSSDDLASWQRLAALLDDALDKEFRSWVKDGVAYELVEVTATDAMADEVIASSRQQLVLITLAALAFSLFSGAILLQSMGVPLRALSEGADAFAGGDLAHRIGLVGGDEFSMLAQRFDAMAAELEARRRLSDSHQNQLEQAVSDRTQQLNEVNANLEEAARSRQRFLADLSHELRTPLTIIRGECDVMLRRTEVEAPEYRRSLQTVLDHARQTSSLVDDLLFVARQEAGELRLKFEAVELPSLLAQICGEVSKICEAREITLTFSSHVSGAQAVVAGDSRRLRQLFLVLLDNAMKYSPASATIDVTARHIMDGVVVVVADSGVGIPRYDLPHVFERYYRGANSERGEGIGLGLPVAKAITEAHGGSIRIESEPMHGTRVYVSLPGAHESKAVA